MATTVPIESMRTLLSEEFDALDALCAPLDEDAWATPTCLPGWSVKDVLAHVAGVERMLEGEPAPEVDVSHLEHLRNDIARMGEVWVEEMRPLPGAEVLERFRDVVGRRRAALAAMTQEDFDAPSWTPVGKDETYGRFMRIRHYDCFLHEHDVRGALGVADRPDPAHVASALAEVEPALGYVVGRKAGFPDGTSVRIEVLGPVPRTYLVAVDGRAAVVDALDGPPSVTLRLQVMPWFRLTGGRCDAAPLLAAGEVALDGDDELGRRLVENLAMTI